jgi:predicted metal-dependent phosphoesterase TrpH
MTASENIREDLRRVKADLHIHTSHSRDSTASPAEVVARARSAGLDRIAVTDHNSIDGAREAAAIDPSLVIIGEEIDCAGGAHLIGLFLHERIPPHLEIEEVAQRIRNQGGIVYAPHPFAYLRNADARARRVLAVTDIVEVHNARAFISAWNRRAHEAARRLGLPCAAGTDSHTGREIGGAFTELPYFEDAAGMRAVLEKAAPVSIRKPLPHVHVISLALHLLKAQRRTQLVSPAARL